MVTGSLLALLVEKDTLVACGVIFTALVGLLNIGYILRHNRRASYVASVTAKRLAWISEVRDHLASYAALAHQYVATPPADPEKLRKIFVQIVEHRMLLRLQLAPAAAPLDAWFEKNIDSVFAIMPSATAAEISGALESLVEVGQKFLWSEWLKVKNEAIHGDPYDSLWRKFIRFFEDGA
jgi:DNA-binding GntR family transcriptional regulator